MTRDVWQELAVDPPDWWKDEGPAGAATDPRNQMRHWPPVLIKDFLRDTETCALTVDCNTLLSQVVNFLADNDDNVVVVANPRGRVMGVVYAAEAQRALQEYGYEAFSVPLIEIMEPAPWCCTVSDSPYVVLSAMQNKNIRRAPVVAGGEIVGAVSVRRILGFLKESGATV